MTTSDLLEYLDSSEWNYSKDYEEKEIYGYLYYRYKDAILTSPNCHFHITVKEESRGRGYAKKLIQHLIDKGKYLHTSVECDDVPRMEKFLIRFGFVRTLNNFRGGKRHTIEWTRDA